jgi:hypothetical protein
VAFYLGTILYGEQSTVNQKLTKVRGLEFGQFFSHLLKEGMRLLFDYSQDDGLLIIEVAIYRAP